jgi:Mor family transcriptional regulator
VDKTTLYRLVNDFPEGILIPYDEMVLTDGIDAVCTFARYYGGSTVYVPRLRHIFRDAVRSEIVKRYRDGEALRDLAREYGYNERMVQNMVNHPTAKAGGL